MTLRLRHLAWINPPTPRFESLPPEAEVSFAPLEAVWADDRADRDRVRTKGEVATGFVRFQDGDVLLPKTAPTFMHGRSMVASDLVNGVGAGSSELHVLRPKEGTDPRYLAYLLRSDAFLREGMSNYEGVAGLQRVSADFVRDWEAPGLTLDQQRAAADGLDEELATLRRIVSLRSRQMALLDERFETLVEMTLRPDGAHTPSVPARHLVDRIGVGIVIQPSALYTEEADGVPAVRGKDITAGAVAREGLIRISPEGHSANRRSELRKGDILVVRSGKAGAAAQVPNELVGGNCIDVVMVRPGDRLDPRYLEYSINCRTAQEAIREHAAGAIQSHFGVEDMKALPIVPRDLDEQRRLASHLDCVRADTNALRSRLHVSLDLLAERQRVLITTAALGDRPAQARRSVA